MHLVGDILYAVLSIYLLILMFRLVMDFVFQFARNYQPRGPMLLALEFTYTLTDPPLKLIRRVVPPLRLGGIAIDLAFIALIVIILVAQALVSEL